MTLADITAAINTIPLKIEGKTVTVYKSVHCFHPADGSTTSSVPDTGKRIFAAPTHDSLIQQSFTTAEDKSFLESQRNSPRENDFAFYASGWQSWGFGGETDKGSYQKKYNAIFPQFKKYITVPGGEPASVLGKKNKTLVGQFIIYFRWDNRYLVVASTGHCNAAAHTSAAVLPPVEYTINRTNRVLTCSVDSFGKQWKKGDVVAELSIFTVHGFFELQEALALLYGNTATVSTNSASERFARYKELSLSSKKIMVGGWESWYNHYNKINNSLIEEDLDSLGTTDNIVKTYIAQNTQDVVFQVDDGWEQGVGQWEGDRSLFPQGMKSLADSISQKGYVPGLWIAPFAIDIRTDFAACHKEWILRDKKGKPVYAGLNLTWGDFCGKKQPSWPCSFFCLDLSNNDVLSYLDSLMDRIVNEWGFRYIKLDFLYAGMLIGAYKNGGASYELYNRAITVLTSRKKNNSGKSVVYLVCGMPFELSFNTLPLSRIGPDTKEAWDMNLLRKVNFSGRPGALVNMQSTLGHAFWDQSIFINDPDVIFLRDTNITLTNNEKELIALVNFLFGGQLMISDDMNETPTPLTRHIVELYKKFADETFGLVNMTSTTYVIFSKSGTYCGIINLSDKDIALNKNDFLKIISLQRGTKVTQESVNASLTPIVQHGAISADYIGVEKHSITILGGQNGR